MSFRAVTRHGVLRSTAIAVGALILAACNSTAHASPPAAAPPPTATRSSATSSPPALSQSAPGPSASAPAGLPAPPAHTVVVVLENHSYSEIIGSPQAPYLNHLARQGALLTHSYAVTHPSEPNYLALFSGSTQGVTDDSCPHEFGGPNLGSELIAAGRTFAGYSEGLPWTGSPVCVFSLYARKHVPWINFSNVPAADSQPFSSFPAGDYARLPTLSFVIPNLCNDMHDCPVPAGDAWLKLHLADYAQWAASHASLLVVTWDENDGSPGNHIPTIFTGQMVRAGRYAAPVTHYGVLRTLDALYRLAPTGHAATAHVITGIWK